MPRLAPSFRDPAGCCLIFNERVLRFVSVDALPEFEKFLQTDFSKKFVAEEKLIPSRRLGEKEVALLRESPELKSIFVAQPVGAVFEHEKIPFQSYPHEWPAEMLWTAASLTLEIAEAAFKEGFCLKDATPNNILFRGSQPVFVDALSFERRNERDPIWKPATQFIRTFLLPLLANRKWNLQPAEIFSTRRDGIAPEEIYSWCGALERLSPQMLSLVTIPSWLSSKANPDDQKIYAPQLMDNIEKAQFIFESGLRRLKKNLNSLKPQTAKSTWSDYMTTHSYDDPAFAAKEKFVREALLEFKPKRVLDSGANTGHFSVLATQGGAKVVAIDLDAACVGKIFEMAREKKMDILPMVINLARPSAGLGWRNAEFPSFLDRAIGKFDSVLMLALIHHLLVTERIPLEEILRLASELTNQLLVIEFVSPEDAMFRRLTRGREQLHASLNEEVFERVCGNFFEIVRSVPLPNSKRRMYCLKRKAVEN